MNNNELIFMDALLSGDTSGAIERSEKREQCNVVRNQRIPIKANDYAVPRELSFLGTTDEMEWAERSEIMKTNNKNWTKEQYEKMGIKIIDEYDDLFLNVELPEDWQVKATDHSMWNDVIDKLGRKRISFFYKGAFYDRDAFSSFERRYTLSEMPFDDYNTDASYEERKSKEWFGVVYDCGKEIYRTEPVINKEYGDETLKNQCIDYLNTNYPYWENTHSYWND